MAGIIDIHAHWCLFGRDPALVWAELREVEAQGFEKMAIFPLASFGAPPERVRDMIPAAYLELTGIDAARAANEDLASWLAFAAKWRESPHTLELLSFLDVRAWDGRADLAAWWGAGHTGLKCILIEDEDVEKMRMPPMRRAQELTRETYLEAQRRVFALAEERDLPLVYHIDLSRHRDFLEECLAAHPKVRVDVPHLGFSRKQMARMLERHENLLTDIASLGPYMKEYPAAYRSFLLDFPDRVMMGSDAIASHDLRDALLYVDHVRSLGLPEEVEAAVLWGNARRFLGERNS